MILMKVPSTCSWVWLPVVPALAGSLVLAGCAETSAPDAIGRVRSPGAALVEDAEIGVSAQPPVRRAPPEHEDDDPSAVLLFHEVLAPYGAWRDDARLGYVWSPAPESVGSAFVPYGTHGRWTYREIATGEATTPEWTWVSDVPWGWVTFHYGRWAYTGERGWAWIPGRKYAGAWVDWRVPAHAGGEAAVGWGPRPPSFLWRVTPLRRPIGGKVDPEDCYFETSPYAAFATPYVYAPASQLFATDLASSLLTADAALAVAHATAPAAAPRIDALGLAGAPAPPTMDRGLLQAWMLATPASAAAVGAGPRLSGAPRLRTWVAGGPRSAALR